MTSVDEGSKTRKAGGHFTELLKVQGKLAVRGGNAIVGMAIPIGLLLVFALIGSAEPGNVGNTSYSVLDIYLPVIMVIGFVFIALGLPTTLVRDREIGWLRRISTTPVHPSYLLAAQLIINLIFALATVLVIIFGGEVIFHVALDVNIPLFIISIILSIAVIFSLGLVLVAIASFAGRRPRHDRGLHLWFDVPIRSVDSTSSSRWTVGDNHILFSIRGSC